MNASLNISFAAATSGSTKPKNLISSASASDFRSSIHYINTVSVLTHLIKLILLLLLLNKVSVFNRRMMLRATFLEYGLRQRQTPRRPPRQEPQVRPACLLGQLWVFGLRL